jgi:hypothetical protein
MTRTDRVFVQILEWFGAANTSDPLIGDLLEELRSGRSRGWLLRQVLAAVAGSIVREAASNKLLSLRAIATGMLVAMPLSVVFKRAADFSWGNGPLQFCFLNCFIFVVAGAAVGHKFPQHRAAMVAVFTLYALTARISLLGFNAPHFFSPSHPFRGLAYAAVAILPPLFTLFGAFLLPTRTEQVEC